jgi:hypothetical protein
MSFSRRILAGLAIAMTAGALIWIAAINMIDASLIVAGRMVDADGKPVPGKSVSLRVGNRVLVRRTDGNGCFFIGTTTTFLRHDAQLSISSSNVPLEATLPAPGRHFLQATPLGLRSISPDALIKLCK